MEALSRGGKKPTNVITLSEEHKTAVLAELIIMEVLRHCRGIEEMSWVILAECLGSTAWFGVSVVAEGC